MVKIKNILSISLIVLCLFILITYLFGFRYRIVLSGSMQDTYPVGGIVVTNKTSLEELNIGEDVTFIHSNGKVVTHRIINIDLKNRRIETKGTTNNEEDGFTSEDNILGKVIFFIPLIGFPIFYIKKYLILIVGLSIAGVLFVKGFKGLKEEK